MSETETLAEYELRQHIRLDESNVGVHIEQAHLEDGQVTLVMRAHGAPEGAAVSETCAECGVIVCTLKQDLRFEDVSAVGAVIDLDLAAKNMAHHYRDFHPGVAAAPERVL